MEHYIVKKITLKIICPRLDVDSVSLNLQKTSGKLNIINRKEKKGKRLLLYIVVKGGAVEFRVTDLGNLGNILHLKKERRKKMGIYYCQANLTPYAPNKYAQDQV